MGGHSGNGEEQKVEKGYATLATLRYVVFRQA
jgi:hypothetical protein